jgi:hypothetical protein
MQISWTNAANEDRVLLLDRMEEHGVLSDIGGTGFLQPGTRFTITLMKPGQYVNYCSNDCTVFGTIPVVP